MVSRYNADLANNFGNLANRVLTMANSYCGGVVPDTRADGPLRRRGRRPRSSSSARRWSGSTSRRAFGAVWELIRSANAFIEDRQPWALNKAGDTVATAGVIGDCLEALRIVALLASPAIPNAARRALAPARAARAPRGRPPPRGGRLGRPPGREPARPGRAAVPPNRPRCPVGRPIRGPERHRRGGPTRTATSNGSPIRAPSRPRGRPRPGAPRPGSTRIVCVGTDLATSRAAVELATKHTNVFATVGLHPHDASRFDDEWDDLVALARDRSARRRDR